MVVAGAGIAIVQRAGRAAEQWCDDNREHSRAAPLSLLALALRGPMTFGLVALGLSRVLRNSVVILDSYVHAFQPKLDHALHHLIEELCSLVVPMDAAFARLYTVLLVALLFAALIQFKTLAVEAYLRALAGGAGSRASTTMRGLESVLLPLNSLASWLLAAMGSLFVLSLLGISLQPVLAIGGAGSLMIGFATQQLLVNAVTGMTLFLTRPFVAGEFITLQQGGTQLSGLVEEVQPVRTIIRTGDDVLLSVPNKAVMDMFIFNRSRTLSTESAADKVLMRQPLQLWVKVPHAAVDGSGSLMATLNEHLQPMVVAGTLQMGIKKFTDAGLEVLVKASVADADSKETQAAMLALYTAVRKQGGSVVASL